METDRFRRRLSLLGVAVGIFSIVAARSLVDCLQQMVQEGFAAFGGEVLYIDREPLEGDPDEDGTFRWWKYAGRPAVTWEEYRALAKVFPESAFVAYGAEVVGVDGQWPLLVAQPLAEGRGLTDRELTSGTARCLAGAETEARCGDVRWLDGNRYEVVGVFEKAGMAAVSPIDVDHAFLVPFRTMRGAVLRSSIAVAGAETEAVRAAMRSLRRLPPASPDTFAVNRLSFLREEMDEVFGLAARLGWIIGLFSLLAGGIGMANMLYVSVEERRGEIGLCRAVGARQGDIARRFIREAVGVALSGGVAGIALAQGAAWIAGIFLRELKPGVSPAAALSGLVAAVVIGLLFGGAPARAAARLHPIDALRK